MNFSILIIDDEEAQRLSLSRFLKKKGYQVLEAESGEKGLELLDEQSVDLVITDFRMPGISGMEVVKKVKNDNPHVEVIVITAYSNIEEAVEIMKQGAYDYLTKPINLDELAILIDRVREKHLLRTENQRLKEHLKENFKFEALVYQSREMEEVVNVASRAAASKASVLIRGESGTGKELIARMIHLASPRMNAPFVVVNVASLSENLIESELFGHEKGAFTGALQQKTGKFQLADGGTLFIDEVGDIPMSAQVKLLRTIQFGEIQRVGSTETITVDVRIVAATHQPLEDLIKEGKFREDLFYRLNVITIHLPPLRERRTDIPLLADAFIKKYAEEYKKPVEGIDHHALQKLMTYRFPGNVRELENMMERAVVLTRNRIINVEDLPELNTSESAGAIFDPGDFSIPYKQKVKAFEKAMIDKALELSHGNKSAAARKLGITERHLRSRLESLNRDDG
ncbi:MAG: sigma-54 dependent transcriptional regulator [Calditrichia bacterium]